MLISEAVSIIESAFTKMNKSFFESELTKPIITIQSSPSAYGHCSCHKIWQNANPNGKGVKETYEINIGAESLNRPIAETMGTLLHEMIHLYCNQKGIQDVSRNHTYHNKHFKEEAEKRLLKISYDKVIGWSIRATREINIICGECFEKLKDADKCRMVLTA